MIATIAARELKAGDVLSTSGATIEQVVPCGHGASVYVRAVFEDGYVQVVTIDAGQLVHVWQPEPTAYDVRRSCEAPLETSDWRWLTCSCGGRLAGCLDNAEEAV